MISFEEFLAEGKLFAYSKDGVRKEVRNDDEASHWRETIAKPVKVKTPRAAKLPEFNLQWVATQIEMAVGDHFPDTDGWDAIFAKMKKQYPQLSVPIDATGVMDKACRKLLHAKDFGDYVDKFHKEHKHLIKEN